MSVSTELSIKPMTISQIFNLYISKKLVVNRQYQRKLCWTIEEKRNFIDTISHGYPVPLFLFALDSAGNYEIIDGMQRLDAICSFIEQKYELKNGFFNLKTMPDTIALLEQKAIKQKGVGATGILDTEVCRNLANYPLPVSVFSLENDEIEEVFKRINSTGRHLSNQELRQVGVNTSFARLVRNLSQEIRGDNSEPILKLNEMSKISLSNHRLPYSITINNTFWIRNKIFQSIDLRQSRDEEVIAMILVHMLLHPKKFLYNSNILNRYYGYNKNPLADDIPEEVNKIQVAIDRLGEERIAQEFERVLSCIEEMLEANKTTFKDLIGASKELPDVGIQFEMVFLTIYRLLILEKKNRYDVYGLGKSLNSASQISKRIPKNQMLSTYKSIYGIIESNFEKDGMVDPAKDDWTRQTINIINKSRTEQDLYDFKVGFFDSKSKSFSNDIFDKVLKTLTAINNVGPNKKGYVIIGIADEDSDAKRYTETFGLEPYMLEGDFPIVGIDHEAKLLQKSIDIYTKNIKERIKYSKKLEEDYKKHLLENMRTPLLFDRQLIVLGTNFNEPVQYDNIYYEREFTDVKKVPPSDIRRLFGKFK
ncbi:DUF262 domain-containing protein [Streptococcus sanguinis]|jgi:hypothetical protein